MTREQIARYRELAGAAYILLSLSQCQEFKTLSVMYHESFWPGLFSLGHPSSESAASPIPDQII